MDGRDIEAISEVDKDILLVSNCVSCYFCCTGRRVFSLVSVGCMRVLVRRGRSTISMWHASRRATRDRSVRRVGDSSQLGTRRGWLGSE